MSRKPLTIKNRHREKRLFRHRLLASVIIVGILLLLLIVRLMYLQLFEHQHYSTLSKKNILDTIPITPNRGLIYDRSGTLIARNIPTFSLEVIPSKATHLKQELAELQKLIPIDANDIQHFEKDRSYYRPFAPEPIMYQLSAQQVAKFYANRYRFPGVSIAAKLIRHYPFNNALESVLGYVGRINRSELNKLDSNNYSATQYIGKTGVERQFEKMLHGTVGNALVEINVNGRVIRTLHRQAPVPGDNLTLTIDSKLQQVAIKALGKEAGAVVAIQPKTGQVLVLATTPNYNPNLFINGISGKKYKALQDNPLHPLYNRAINGQYASGSTVKPFYALAGLDLGIITPSSEIFDPGWYKIPGNNHIFHDWKHNGHGWVNVIKAIYVSCDTFFYHLAYAMGVNRMDKVLDYFGFGKKTGIQMPNESKGLVPTPSWKKAHVGSEWYTGDTINFGIGQGYFLITPVQLAVATATLANRGVRYQPTLIKQIQLPSGKIVTPKPVETSVIKLKDKNAWNVVIDGMKQVITNPYGTGEHFGRHPGYTVAAKTGTAQVYGHHRDETGTEINLPKRLRSNHSFIAFAPVKNPKIAIAVVVEHNDLAARVARKVLDYYLLTQGYLHPKDQHEA